MGEVCVRVDRRQMWRERFVCAGIWAQHWLRQESSGNCDSICSTKTIILKYVELNVGNNFQETGRCFVGNVTYLKRLALDIVKLTFQAYLPRKTISIGIVKHL